MKRWNWILLITLIVQVALAVGFNLPSGSSPAVTSGPLLTDFSPDAVDGLTITDNEDNQIVLAKVDDEWVLPEADNYPARGDSIDSVLQKIQNLQANRLIAQNPTSQARLEVKDDKFQRRLEIKQGDRTDILYIGTSGGVNATHMRVNDDNRVFLTENLAAWEVRPAITSWVNTTYFTTPRANIVELTLENENGTFEFIKVGDEWTYNGLNEGETFDPDSISSLLTNVANVRLTEPIGKEFGFDPVLATVTMTVEETVQPDDSAAEATPEATAEVSEPETVTHTYTLRLGPQIEDSDDHAFISSESDYYVQVGKTFSDAVLNITHDSLLLVPDESGTDATGS